jgi:hypothetical protein
LFSADADRPFGELTPTFVRWNSAHRALFDNTTHLHECEHFLTQLPGLHFVYPAPNLVEFQRAEQFFKRLLKQNIVPNVQSIARDFPLRRFSDGNKRILLTRADRDLLRYENQRYRDELTELTYQKWAAGGPEERVLEALLSTQQKPPQMAFRTHLSSHNAAFLAPNPGQRTERDLPRSVLYPVLHPVLHRARPTISR